MLEWLSSLVLQEHHGLVPYGVKLQRHGVLFLKSHVRTSRTNRLTSCLL